MASAKIFWRAITNEYNRTDIVSQNLDEAKDKVKYIKDLYHTIPLRYRPYKHSDNLLTIGFHPGNKVSMINSRAASSSGIRGGRKNLLFDEAQSIPDFRNTFVSAIPAASRKGGMFEQVFTPLGQQGGAWEIHTNQGNAYGQFNRHEFGWWDVTAFSKDVELAHKRWHEEYEEDWGMMAAMVDEFGQDGFKQIISPLTTEEFHQEFCGRFVDEAASIFTWELMDSCAWWPTDQEDGKPWLEQWTDRPDSASDSEVYLGIDWAEGKAGGDSTCIQVMERTMNGECFHRASFILDHTTGYKSLPPQVDYVMDNIIPRFKPNRVRLDATGLGIFVKDKFIERYGYLIDPVPFSMQQKEELVSNTRYLFESKKVVINKSDKRLMGQMHGIQRKLTSSGNWVYEGDKHDDMFWAFALACKGLGRTPFRIIGRTRKRVEV